MRKEILLGTTALLAGAVAMPDYVSAEEPLRLQVRGFKHEFFAVGDVDGAVGTDYNNTGEFSDGEVQFRGETALDNGLTIGVQVELEADSRGDQIDEAYAFIKGDFGKVVAGGENLANYNTFWGVVAPSVGVPINSGWITVFVPPPAGHDLSFRSTITTTNVDIGNDENALSYYSPRFAGFQFTGGYAPAVVDTGEGKTFTGFEADKTFEYYNAFGVGLNFSDSFNGIDVKVAGGYNQISAPQNVEALGGDDVQQVKVGANLGYAGFSVGGSYANEFEGKQIVSGGAITRSEEGRSWDVGGSYSTGPWGISGTYFHGQWEANPLQVGDDELDSFVGAISYALGPGITTSLSVLYGKLEDEGGATGEATMGILGISVSF